MATLVVSQKYRSNKKTGNDKKYIDPDKSARKQLAAMEEKDGEDGDAAQSVDILPVFEHGKL